MNPTAVESLAWPRFDTPMLESLLVSLGYPPAHARPILRAWYASAGRLDSVADRLGPKLTRLLGERVAPMSSRVARLQPAADGTAKLLIEFPDQAAVEAVYMPCYKPGRAMACVSSQVGCAMGCDFCASTLAGVQRDLAFGQIVEQFVHLQELARRDGRRISSLVFMGMGEPMLNLDNVIGAVRRIADPDLGAVGWRNVTVSTVGIVPGIDALASADLNVHLAISLHAADDELRSRIVPMNRKYPIAAVLDAARRFYDRTGRIVTIQWCMLEGINDSEDQAAGLASLLCERRMLRMARVNVIPFNPIGTSLRGVIYRRPDPLRTKLFIERLQLANVVAHQRDTRGDEVSAACGQLRRAVESRDSRAVARGDVV